MFRNILVSVDGSADSDDALTEAIDLAKAAHGRLTLFTAVQQPPSIALTGVAGATAAGVMSEDLERESQELLTAAEQRIPEDVSVSTILTRGPVRTALLDAIRDGDYDLVAMGSRGRGAVSAAVLGSVSHFVLNHSLVPMLIVHHDREEGRVVPPEDDSSD
jgi:nucleotide-binding universal stress UspA family protein